MKIVQTNNAPKAIGPYSQAIIANGMVFCSGQIALSPEGDLLKSEIKEQTEQVMINLSEVLKASGSGFDKVVKTTIYLANMKDFAKVNDIYASYFKNENKPARTTVEVSSLPKSVLVEIDCIAVL